MSMQCEEARSLIELYADDELDVSRSVALEDHLGECASCALALEEVRSLSRAVRGSGVYGAAPSGLVSRTRASVLGSGAAEGSSHVKPHRAQRAIPYGASLWVAAAAALIAAVFLFQWIPYHGGRNGAPPLIQEIADNHVRSLMADHLVDVPSTDQHTVKPWFDGKVDFSPPVIDLAGDGFELVGGRLDYMDGRPVATVVYRRRKHVINVSMWPDKEVSTLSSSRYNGYTLYNWDNGHMEYWAVSDLNAAELHDFVTLLQNKIAAAAR